MTSANVRRILVALDASAHSQAALEEAATLATRLQAELAGIFVLDSELLRLSALPLASETGLTSAQHRTLNPESMERALRMQADRARRSLEAVARRHHLTATFQLLRGNVITELLRAAEKTDLLALGMIGQMNVTRPRLGSTVKGISSRASCSVLLLRPDVRKGSSVVAVYGRSQHADSALTLAAELAAQRGSELVVLLCAPEESAGSLKDRVSEQLAPTGAESIIESIGIDGFDRLKEMLQRYDSGLLVLASDCELIEGHENAFASLDVPVLLARPPLA